MATANETRNRDEGQEHGVGRSKKVTFVLALLLAVGPIVGVMQFNSTTSEYEAKKTAEVAAQEMEYRQGQERIALAMVHNSQLDADAQSVIEQAPPVLIHIKEMSPALDSCRVVVWQVPANVIQEPVTAKVEHSKSSTWDKYDLSTSRPPTINTRPVLTEPIVNTDFEAAHEYIVDNPDLLPVIEPCKTGNLQDATEVDSPLFPAGTVVTGLPFPASFPR